MLRDERNKHLARIANRVNQARKPSRRISQKRMIQLYLDVKNGVPMPELEIKYPMSHKLYAMLIEFIMKTRKDERKEEERPCEPMRYWETEDEMLIPDYKVNDLKGEELEIFRKLAEL